jgi:DNA-binding MarR family transcriptional regulator
MANQAKHVQLVNTRTAETLDGVVAWIPTKYSYRQNFFTMFQDVLRTMAKLPLSGRDMQVLHFLMGTMDWENWCLIEQTAIAEELELKKQNVNRSLKKLIEHNVILKENRKGRTPAFRINNTLLWKGEAKTYRLVVKDDPIVQEVNPNQLSIFPD